jgi:MFS family permease
MSFIGKLVKFIQGQSRNYQVSLTRGVFATFLNQLVQNFNDLYIVTLGATPFQLGTVRAVGSAFSALISIPAGWFSDVHSAKKIMIFGMLIQILSVALYAFAQNWVWIVVAIVFATLTMTLVFRMQNIFIANSLDDHNRAMGYGMRTAIIQFFSIFAPTIGGILVNHFGGISAEGIRPLYFIQLIGFTLLSIYVSLKLVDLTTQKKPRTADLFGQYREMFQAGTCLKRFVFLQALGSVTWGMSMPFLFVYAADFKGADSLVIGYMGTCLVLVSMLLAVPLGSLADSKGRKLVIFVTRPFLYGSLLLLVLAPRNSPWLLLLAWCMRGVMMSSNAWMALSMEMVPREYRGRWMGFNGLFQNLIRVLAMIIGGFLYESTNPALVFLIPVCVDALLRMPILATIPETLK